MDMDNGHMFLGRARTRNSNQALYTRTYNRVRRQILRDGTVVVVVGDGVVIWA